MYKIHTTYYGRFDEYYVLKDVKYVDSENPEMESDKLIFNFRQYAVHVLQYPNPHIEIEEKDFKVCRYEIESIESEFIKGDYYKKVDDTELSELKDKVNEANKALDKLKKFNWILTQPKEVQKEYNSRY